MTRPIHSKYSLFVDDIKISSMKISSTQGGIQIFSLGKKGVLILVLT